MKLKFKINFLCKLALVGSAYIIFFQNISFAETPLNIAFIDTGFCPDKIKIKNVKIKEAIDFTNSVALDCKKMDQRSPRFHGQLLLEEFFKFYDLKKGSLTVYPLIVFDKNGDQKESFWVNAISWIRNNKIDVVVTASGFYTNKKLIIELPALWFVPSGRLAPKVKKQASLFPQNLAPQENLFIIGDYHDGKQVLYDQALLYQDKIDYYFPSGKTGFRGTSRAVAEASARALNHCPVKTMRTCLKKIQKEYFDSLSNRKIQTF